MFRIDRSLVNLAVCRSVQVDENEEAAGAEETLPDASASIAFLEQAREIIAKAEADAGKILEDARNEAAALILSAREEAEEGRRCAWQEGYAEGSAEGGREGRRIYDEKYAQKAREDDDMLKRVITELRDESKRAYDGLEDEVIGLTFDIVRKILGPVDDQADGAYEALIRNALRQIAPEGKVIIRVSPAEYERFFASGSAFFELDKGVTITAAVLRDASLEAGDCIIDTENETVNAGLETQLKYIKIAFSRADE